MLWRTSVFWNLCHNVCKWWFNNEMLCATFQHKAYWLKITACLWRTHTNKNQYYFHWEAWCFWIRGSVLIINMLLPCLDKILVLNSHIICFWFLELVPKIQWTLIVSVSAVMHNMTCYGPTIALLYNTAKWS